MDEYYLQITISIQFYWQKIPTMMNLSINSKFGTKRSQTSLPMSQNPPSIQAMHTSQQLIQVIQQYQQMEQFNQQTQSEKQQQTSDFNNTNNNQMLDMFIDMNVKNDTKPVRMFKDKMELKKQNIEKRVIVKQLEQLNEKLKLEYDVSLNNNKKMEMFLKQIQFTFKNDRSNQKANETLLKATKTLHRQEMDSKNYIQKLTKATKTNQMRQLKAYMKVLATQKTRLQGLLQQQLKLNKQLRQNQDFNEQQLQIFDECQMQLKQMLQQNLDKTLQSRQQYKKDKCKIRILLNYKQVQYTKRQSAKIDQLIAQQLFKKQGLQYQMQIVKNKMKQKNKRNIKQQGSMLKQQIKNKRRKIYILTQQLKQKIKTQQYIIKWTKQLKNKFKDLEKDHSQIKQKYKQEINKLSSQIQEWNRMYKVQLIEEQNNSKKQAIKQNQSNKQNGGIQRKIRVVKIYEIDHLRKLLIFHIIQNDLDPIQFVKQNILGYGKTISLKDIHKRLSDLPCFEEETQADLLKLARYMVQDNNKANTQETVQTNIALLIFKNLLITDLSHNNIPIIKTELKEFLTKNFDSVRHQIWLSSGKSTTFNLVNLRQAFSKYIKQQMTIAKFIQLIQYLLWKKFGEGEPFKLFSYQKLCEQILGRKLVKDSQNRISKTTIRSVFDKVYKSELNQIKNQ